MIFNEYIINGEVIFSVNANELRPLVGHGETVSLNAPTARCLQLLLESQGEIVSREEFLDTVWKTRGVVVSQNTFYQNISLLRRSLAKAGLSRNIISTVRQQGFVLVSDLYITPSLETKNSPAESAVNIHDGNASVPPSDSHFSAKKDVQTHEDVRGRHDKKQSIFKLPGWVLPLLVATMVANVLSLFWLVVINE